jgi:hypothetical protein
LVGPFQGEYFQPPWWMAHLRILRTISLVFFCASPRVV